MKKTHVSWSLKRIKKDRSYYLMFLPIAIFLIVFNYVPMIGLINAFYKFTPVKHEFIGLANFIDLFTGIKSNNFWRAFSNTLFLSIMDLILATIISVIIALLLNELPLKNLKSITQSILYLPHFLSWIVVASIFTIIFSPNHGFVNNIRGLAGFEPIYFLAEESWWKPLYLFICRWKETGLGTIIYLAALSGINPVLYEASAIDGANRWHQTIHITIPEISTTIMTVFILNLGRVMLIFQSVFALQNDNVFAVSDVLQTFEYRTGIVQANYGMGTAISFFSSFVGLILVYITNKINKKISGSSLL